MQTPADLTAQLRLNFGGGALPSLAHKNMHLVVKSSTASLTRFIRQTRRSYGEQTNITLVSPVQAQPIDTKVHTLVMHFMPLKPSIKSAPGCSQRRRSELFMLFTKEN